MCAQRAAVPRLVVTACLKPPPQREHTRLLGSVCATSTGDKSRAVAAPFPQSPPAFSPARRHRELVTCLQIVPGPGAQEPSHCWEQGTGSKVRGEVQRVHIELQDSTKHSWTERELKQGMLRTIRDKRRP